MPITIVHFCKKCGQMLPDRLVRDPPSKQRCPACQTDVSKPSAQVIRKFGSSK